MKKALVIQHTTETPPGTVLDWCKARGFSPQITCASKLPYNFPIDSIELLFVMGGEMNVDQEDLYPWLRQEKEFIRRYIDSGKKAIGICLGGQLMAEVLGAKVHRHEHWELGWHEIDLDFSTLDWKPHQLGDKLVVFQWHGYRFHLPEGATRIGTNLACSDQAYVFKNVLGLQFHPESTEAWVRDCADEAHTVSGRYVQSKEEILSKMHHQAVMQNWFFHLLDKFTL